MSDEYYEYCGVCGRKVPMSQIVGICTRCNRTVCFRCAREVNGRIMCVDDAPPPPPPPSGCFIATAAYGTPFSSELDILRSFRDNTLIISQLGRIFVRIYYKISPPIAQFISTKESLKLLVRKCLNPIVSKLKHWGY